MRLAAMARKILAGVLGLVLTVAAGVAWYGLVVPGRSFSGALPDLSAAERRLASALETHVRAIASAPHNARHPNELEHAARYIEAVLKASGYEPDIQAYEIAGQSFRNLIASIAPLVDHPLNQTVVIGAHYDSFYDAPGANDNGTGTAAVLELARLLFDNRPANVRIRFVLFVNEEPPFFQTGAMGSVRYAELLAQRNERVKAMLSLETIGFFSDEAGSQQYPTPLRPFFPGKGNFIAFVGMPGSRTLLHEAVGSFRRHTSFPTVGGIAPGIIPGIGWSDHWAFAQREFLPS